MKVSKRVVRMPQPLATKEEEAHIKQYLFQAGRSFSGYAIEAVLEKIEREKSTERLSRVDTSGTRIQGPLAEAVGERIRRINRDIAPAQKTQKGWQSG